jgi:hypothetical protein
LLARIERLWGTGVLPRYPTTLITQPHPFIGFGTLLRPAADLWQELAMTCWWLCFGGYARHSLEQLEAAQANERHELEKLGVPIDAAVYRELCDAGRGHDWLFGMQQTAMTITISLSKKGEVVVDDGYHQRAPAEANDVFLQLRPILDRHRRRWLDQHLELWLDALWRSDLGTAATSYWTRYRGKGSAPTIKQALPDVLSVAERWFGGDFGAVARMTGLEGPTSESPMPTGRRLPDDLPLLRKQVSETLRRVIRPGAIEEREAGYRASQFASRVDDLLTYWQAAGTAPPRSAIFGSGYARLTEQLFGCDPDGAYELLLAATRDALGRCAHAAAGELEVP